MSKSSIPTSRYYLFFGIAIVGLLLDLWTKRFMFQWLGMPGESQSYWVIDGFFGFQTSLNEGALFGLGQGMIPLFVVLSVVAAVGITCWLFVGGAARDLVLTIAMAMIMAGIFGNLYDRLGIPNLNWNYANPPLHEFGEKVYAVRDWIRFDFGSYTWPNFNIADSFLVCGAILLGLHAFLMPSEQVQSDKNEKSKDDTIAEPQKSAKNKS